MTDDDDAWDAFGSDSDKEEEIANSGGWTSAASAVSLFLSQEFLKANAQIKLQDRIIDVCHAGDDQETCDGLVEVIQSNLAQRGFILSAERDADTPSHPTPDYLDALICIGKLQNEDIFDRLVPGGILITTFPTDEFSKAIRNKLVASSSSSLIIHESDGHTFFGVKKRSISAHLSICPWLPSTHSPKDEQQYLELATVALSASEAKASKLTKQSIDKATAALSQHGYCIIRQILDPAQSSEYGQAVLKTVHDAAKILKARDRVDIYNPQASEFEPQAYRELSMREDLRLDIRHGTHLSAIRSKQGDAENVNRIITSRDEPSTTFFRGHADLLDVIRLTMNPKSEQLYRGNIGRYNFEGTGPDGSFQDLRVSPVGGIVSFPGAAEQALHADTPHLFENIPDLPAHYINIFTPGGAFDDQVGGTAFVHGSHNLEFTAKYCGSDKGDDSEAYPFLVRPCLTLGDVVLFDCRILHFGLANTSKTVERPLLYSNTTHAWFHDPKNWDDKVRIFE